MTLTHRLITSSLILAAGALALPAAAPAAYPGTNGQVAFTSTQDGGARHIFVTTPAGIVDLTGVASSASEIEPKFSPTDRRSRSRGWPPAFGTARYS